MLIRGSRQGVRDQMLLMMAPVARAWRSANTTRRNTQLLTRITSLIQMLLQAFCSI